MKRVLVLSPHPDDEAIGCGGTLLKHAEEGDAVHVVFLTSGEAGGHGRGAEETRRLREAESAAAAAVLGVDAVEFWREPDGGVRARRRLVDRLLRKLEAWQPEVVYVTHPGEAHPDHRAALRLVRRALLAADARIPRPTILMYEVWTPMQRVDQVVDISSYIAQKVAAIQAHRSQCNAMRFDDASRGLARWRGEMHCWPHEYGADVFAEAFQEMR
jgi:N-acetylglucosamine malate deacetylase 1